MTRNKVISIILLLISLLAFSFAAYEITLRYKPVNPNAHISNKYSLKVSPAKLHLPSIGIELPVVSGQITNGEWEKSSEGVSYLASSPIPGSKGNSVMYGHNWPNLLGNLNKIKKGDDIFVELNDGQKVHMTVRDSFVVTSDQTHILSNTEDSRLTLYTCAGFLDQKRLVVVATPTKGDTSDEKTQNTKRKI